MSETWEQSFRRHKKRIVGYSNKWAKILGVNNYKRYTYFTRNQSEFSSPGTVACVHCSWEYLEVAITWNMTKIIKLDPDDKDLEYMVIHEFMHTLVNEMRERGIKHEERVVTNLSWAIRWAYQAGVKEGKRK